MIDQIRLPSPFNPFPFIVENIQQNITGAFLIFLFIVILGLLFKLRKVILR